MRPHLRLLRAPGARRRGRGLKPAPPNSFFPRRRRDHSFNRSFFPSQFQPRSPLRRSLPCARKREKEKEKGKGEEKVKEKVKEKEKEKGKEKGEEKVKEKVKEKGGGEGESLH